MVNTRKFEGRSFIMNVHVLVYTAGLMHFMIGLCWVILFSVKTSCPNDCPCL